MSNSLPSTTAAPSTTPLKPILTLIGTTAFEAAGLITWLELDERGMSGLGLLILFAGLVLERLVVVGIPKELDGWIGIIGSAVWEYSAWALWFVLIDSKGINPIFILALVLLPGLHFQHAFIISLKNRDKTFAELARHTGFIAFSLIEVIGGGIWLAVLTATTGSHIPVHLIIIVALTIEHIVQGIVLDRLNDAGKLTQMAKAH